jgi:hypothetical protein
MLRHIALSILFAVICSTIASAAQLETRELQTGAKLWADRDYQVIELADVLQGLPYWYRPTGAGRRWLPADFRMPRDGYVILLYRDKAVSGETVVGDDQSAKERLVNAGWNVSNLVFLTSTPRREASWHWIVAAKRIDKGDPVPNPGMREPALFAFRQAGTKTGSNKTFYDWQSTGLLDIEGNEQIEVSELRAQAPSKGRGYSATAHVRNASEHAQLVCIYLAVYDGDKQLIACATYNTKAPIKPGASKEASMSLGPAGNISDAKYYQYRVINRQTELSR